MRTIVVRSRFPRFGWWIELDGVRISTEPIFDTDAAKEVYALCQLFDLKYGEVEVVRIA